MEFKQAVGMMREGYKMRRRCWGNSDLSILRDFSVLEIDDLCGEDWEIYNENKCNLSDTYLDFYEIEENIEETKDEVFYSETNIKEAVKKLKTFINEYISNTSSELDILKKVNKIFGDRLI